MIITRYGIDHDPKTVEVRMAALAAEGFTAASFGLSEQQLRHHLDPCREPELFELWKIDPVGRSRLWEWLSSKHKDAMPRPNGHAGDAPPNGYANGEASPKHFELIPWKDISFDLEEECRVERVLPLVGTGCLYGGPGTLKTFILLDLFERMARGGFWGGREVKQCPVVYIAAEGGNGIKKRIDGLKKVSAEKGLPADVPFHLVTVAPNLGTGNGDCKKLITDTEAAGVQPGAIAIDTTTQALGGADENGAGMDSLVVNATAIANHFQCFVFLVHHTPVADDERLRGKTSLLGGLDVSIISKREKGSLTAPLIVKKMRDEDDEQAFTAHLVRVVLGKTKKGREVSTLVVETVEPGAAESSKVSKKLPVSATNALSALRYALDEVGALPPACNHIPAEQRCVTVEQWRKYFYMRSGREPDKMDCPATKFVATKSDPHTVRPDTHQKTFVRGRDKLRAEKIITIWDTYVWLTK